MAAYLNMDTLRFQLYYAHHLEELVKLPHFADYDLEAIDMMLDAVKDFSDNELYPIYREMDEQAAYYSDGKIIVHPALGDILTKAGEMGLIGSTFNYEDGGMQLPSIVSTVNYFIMEAANNNVPGYTGLTTGSAELIVEFGSDELKQAYVPNMMTGKWAGTMCLTEPQAGSSLSDIKSTAYLQEDGTYKIKGQKIFISGGDHEYCENFIHLFLARIDGAPAGTKGISLFVVPKLMPTENGFEPNDVTTAGDFQKMGQRGYCTTHLAFGDNDGCTGFIVGDPHRGLKYMFLMMNNARIGVGRGGVSIACAAYHASLQYAKERPQGRRINADGRKNASEEQALIIEHADVRRMLLSQKAIYEGALSLTLQASLYHDLATQGAEEDREKNHLLLEILTPIVKTYPAEKGRESVNNGVQILGGYGFCEDFVLQQYLRDIRIFSLYEGTTGIQSLDLLGRKMTMQNGKAMQLLATEIHQTITAASNYEDIKPYAAKLADSTALAQKIIGHLLSIAQKGNHEVFLSDATIFMQFFGTLVIGWQWLKLGLAAKETAASGAGNFKAGFHEATLKTMRFYFTYELPQMEGFAAILQNTEELTILEGEEWIF